MEKLIINIGDKKYCLLVNDFDEDIEIEDFLKIDMSNILGEMVTFPVIVNRFGMMLADAQSRMGEAKLNLEIQESKIKAEIREKWEDAKKPTVDQLNNLVIENESYQKSKRKCIEAEKIRDYMSSIYDSLKDKSFKLNRFLNNVESDDISDSVIEGRINGILIKKIKQNNLIK